jgi:hypothetical protein
MTPKQQSILVGGLVTGVLSTSYLGLINFACCLGVILGAIVAVWHYTSEQGVTVEAGDGALMGAAAGAIGALVSTILTLAIIQPLGLGLDQVMMDVIRDMDLTAETRKQIEMQAEQGNTVSGVAFGVLSNLVLFSVFGAIGGAIGAAIFRKDDAGDDASQF